jgi:hypothetical protein
MLNKQKEIINENKIVLKNLFNGKNQEIQID